MTNVSTHGESLSLHCQVKLAGLEQLLLNSAVNSGNGPLYMCKTNCRGIITIGPELVIVVWLRR